MMIAPRRTPPALKLQAAADGGSDTSTGRVIVQLVEGADASVVATHLRAHGGELGRDIGFG